VAKKKANEEAKDCLSMKRIMYIENKAQDGLDGSGRIGWVELSRSRRAYRYRGKLLQKVVSFKHNGNSLAQVRKHLKNK